MTAARKRMASQRAAHQIGVVCPACLPPRSTGSTGDDPPAIKGILSPIFVLGKLDALQCTKCRKRFPSSEQGEFRAMVLRRALGFNPSDRRPTGQCSSCRTYDFRFILHGGTVVEFCNACFRTRWVASKDAYLASFRGDDRIDLISLARRMLRANTLPEKDFETLFPDEDLVPRSLVSSYRA